MKINKKDILLTTVNVGKRKESGEPYVMLTFFDEDGNQFTTFETNIEIATKVRNMEKWKVNLEVTGAKTGARIRVTEWIEKIGQV